jgi:hypothetical protein
VLSWHDAIARIRESRVFVSRTALIALVGVLLAAPAAALRDAAEPPGLVRPYQLTAADGEIRIDGALDEPIWDRLEPHDDFRVIEPDTLVRPDEPTRVRFAYDDDGLYVGVTAVQDPSTLVARLTPRDARVNRDTISLTVDPTGNGLYGYWFAVSLGGSLTDGTVLPEREFTNEWDGPWRGESATTDDGWSAEFFLPWSMMAMPASGSDRRIAFYISRKVAHLDERWAMPALPRTQPQFMSVLRPIELVGVQPRRQLTLYPFSSATVDASEGDLESKVGTDFYWRPNSNLQLSATLNPDFGTIEQDDIDVNFSAFETFFSEQRAFFLEGQEIFVTSPRATGNYDSGPPVLLVNTRRIGAPPTLPDADVDRFTEDDRIRLTELYGAGKVTGQVGAVRYGVLAAAERDTEVTGIDASGTALDFHVPGRRFAAVRGLHEATDGGAYRAFGGIVTAVGQPGADAATAALDGHLLTADGRWKADVQALASDANERTGFGLTGDVVLTPSQGRTHRLGFEFLDDEIDLDDVGFLRRNDQLLFDYRWDVRRSDLEGVRERETSVRYRHGWNLDGKLISSGLFVEREWTFHDLSEVRAEIGLRPARWDDRNSFGNGAFQVENRGVVELRWESDDSRALSGGISAGARHEDLQGLSFDGRIFALWRPSDRLAADLSLQYKDRSGWLLHQQDRDFTTFDAIEWRPELTVDYFFSARQQLRATMQWVGLKASEQEFLRIGENGKFVDRMRDPGAASDDFSLASLVFQLRYRWEIAPLSDLFVVYSRGGSLDEPGGASFDTMLADNVDDPDREQLVVKLRYRLGS